MDQERLDAILYAISIIVALVAVRRLIRRAKPPDVAVILQDNKAEIAHRLKVLESLLDQAAEP